jgi:hypothetical protein
MKVKQLSLCLHPIVSEKHEQIRSAPPDCKAYPSPLSTRSDRHFQRPKWSTSDDFAQPIWIHRGLPPHGSNKTGRVYYDYDQFKHWEHRFVHRELVLVFSRQQ